MAVSPQMQVQLRLSVPSAAPLHPSKASSSQRAITVPAQKFGGGALVCRGLGAEFLKSRRGCKCQASSANTPTNTSQFAKEMERVAAKEALLLAIKDTGGVDAFSSGTSSDSGRVEVNEKVLNLERLNPTPRPTTSPLLEGVWNIKWAGARSPGVRVARLLLQRFPPALVKFNSLTLTIAEESATVLASLDFLQSIKTSASLTIKLVVEGPIKLKEEYVEGTLEAPVISEEAVPSQLKGLYDQLSSAYQSLPDSVKQTVNDGLKIPLAGSFSRQLLISYLDEEILIGRDQTGAPDVLLRAGNGGVDGATEVIPEYLS